MGPDFRRVAARLKIRAHKHLKIVNKIVANDTYYRSFSLLSSFRLNHRGAINICTVTFNVRQTGIPSNITYTQ